MHTVGTGHISCWPAFCNDFSSWLETHLFIPDDVFRSALRDSCRELDADECMEEDSQQGTGELLPLDLTLWISLSYFTC